MATSEKHGVLLSQTSPAFLHANSTSHTWAFSAVAELIDNSYDPDVAASSMWIDKKVIYDETCLIFMDNGTGLYPDRLHRMLSFGYCDKIEIKGHKPVGHYGNGFKSGSMRLGKDAMVFTKKVDTLSVGFLSQTYLKEIKSETVLVPIISWNASDNKIIAKPDSKASLAAITKHSLFKAEIELLMEFEALAKFKTGTRIVIYNLKKSSDGKLELDIESDPHDIINSEHQIIDSNQGTAYRPVREYTPEYRRSLREYCSTLFLKPRMKIFLRSKKVKTKLISKSLSNTETDSYKPQWLSQPMKIVFGFNQSGTDYGVMMYHSNRLIKAYEKVGFQRQQTGQGKAVVGVVEVDFLEPIHNKQDFNKTDKYNACMTNLGMKLNDYWNEKTNQGGAHNPVQIKPDWDWVQCDSCLKWRRLPDGVDSDDLPEKWYCFRNQDVTHNRCEVPEEPEDEDWVLRKGASYQKIHKKQIEKQKEKKRLTLEEQKKQLEEKERGLQQIISTQTQKAREMSHQEIAKQQQALQQAKLREQQQRQLIEKLQKEKVMAERQQQMLAQVVQNNNTLKRKAAVLAPAAGGKKVRMVDVDEDFVVEENESSGDEDQPVPSTSTAPPPKPTTSKQSGGLKVKLVIPPKKKKENVIVIDSGDELDPETQDRESPVDKKPDVAELDKAMEKPAGDQPNGTVSTENGVTGDDSTEQPNGDVKPPESPPTQDKSKQLVINGNLVAMCLSHRMTQTDDVHIKSENPSNAISPEMDTLRQELLEKEAKLTSLRTNVTELLRVILPDLAVNNLEDIDQIVMEAIRVNTEDGNMSQLLSPRKEEKSCNRVGS